MLRLVCRLAYFMTSHTWQHRTHCYNSARNDSHTFSHQKSEVSPFTWFVHSANDTSGEGCPTRQQEGNWMSWIKMGGWEEREAKIENSAACTWQADKALSRLESHLLFVAACVIRWQEQRRLLRRYLQCYWVIHTWFHMAKIHLSADLVVCTVRSE